jgi:hypothetical protein
MKMNHLIKVPASTIYVSFQEPLAASITSLRGICERVLSSFPTSLVGLLSLIDVCQSSGQNGNRT